MFIPEVLMAARTMAEVLEKLEPFLSGDGKGPRNNVVIGTVTGDLHDIGADGYAPDAGSAAKLAKSFA